MVFCTQFNYPQQTQDICLVCSSLLLYLTGILLMCRRKVSKKKLKELIWGSRVSSYKIECTEEDVKQCIVQLTHQAPKHTLKILPCNGSESTYTITSRRLLPASMTPTALNQRGPNRAPLVIPLHRRVELLIEHSGKYMVRE